ncbi:MAG: hypothetical protein ABIG61_11860 [Planctomycetota bacterium]
MSKPNKIIAGFFILTCFFLSGSDTCPADTFTHKQTGEVLHGYAAQKAAGRETIVRTVEKGVQRLNLSDYEVKYDKIGRTDKIIIFNISQPIQSAVEAEVIEKALAEASNKGPLFILFELDTAGGNSDVIKIICAAITKTRNCPVYAFVNGTRNNGTFAAAVMIALACDRIYISPQSCFGAAKTDKEAETQNIDLRERFGDSIGEKFASGYRAYVASLAERNKRPALLAMAMVDEQIEVMEVLADGKKLFIEPIDKKQSYSVVRTWSKRGELLTLSAQEAVDSGMAEMIVNSRTRLFEILEAANGKVTYENSHIKARDEFEKIQEHFSILIKNVNVLEDEKLTAKERRHRLLILSKLIRSYEDLVDLVEHNRDLRADILTLHSRLNSARADYRVLKSQR